MTDSGIQDGGGGRGDASSAVSVPRGGPIYVADMVGPLTRVPDFEASVLQELEKLRAEVYSDFCELSDDEDISVSELRVISEEELVNKAFKEAFKDGEETDSSSKVSGEHPNAGKKDDGRISSSGHNHLESSGVLEDASASYESLNSSPIRTADNGRLRRKIFKKRKRKGCTINHQILALKDDEETGSSSKVSEKLLNAGRKYDGRISSSGHKRLESSGVLGDASTSYETLSGSPIRTADNGKLSRNIFKKRNRKGRTINHHNDALKESYIRKVEQLAEVKQKQDEEKAAARLHSFNGSDRNKECATMSADRTVTIKALKSMSTKPKVKTSNIHKAAPVIHPEVVLCIEVYHSKRTWAKTQEFLVLGCQPLTELRDCIYCMTDELMNKAGQHDPSGYFLIEEVFCNDLRDPSAIDYSKPVFDWLRDSEDEALKKWECIVSGELQQRQKALFGSAGISQLPRFKAVDMQTVRFCDLRFRLGAGYLYCHQGDCKHVIVVRDMRLIHPEDVQNRAAYPITTFQIKLRFQKCSVCKIYRAEKVTVDDKWAPENPCYFCKNCYYMLHYANGSLLYDEFSVYDYHHE